MRRTQANISLFELTKITDQREPILQALSSHTSVGKEVYASQVMSSNPHEIIKSIVNAIYLCFNTLCLQFILTFEIFNYNVHNCLLYFGASANVMPLSDLGCIVQQYHQNVCLV